MGKITGIYKITSPSGKIYIGQSREIMTRWAYHRRAYKSVNQPKLHHSFLKHGVADHSFFLIHALPTDIEQHILDQYEQLYMDQYKYTNHILLNLKDAGTRGKCSDETREKMSKSKKGKPCWNKGTTASEETKEKMRIARSRYVFSAETGIKISQALKGRPKSDETKRKLREANLGKMASAETREKQSISRAGKRRGPMSEETKKKIGQKNKGRKMKDDTKVKISAAIGGGKHPWCGRKHTEETKAKLREIGKLQIHLPCSEKQKHQISMANKGRVKSAQEIEKISLGLKAFHHNKKLSHAIPQ